MFSLRYRDDPSLTFLQFCSHADLKDLADILMTTKKGVRRRSEQLSADPHFWGSRDDLTKVWQNIAAELQRFGGDAFMNLCRGGKGVLYREILTDVCKHLKVDVRADEELPVIENRVLIKVLKEVIEKMSEEERAEFVKSAANLFADGKFDPAGATAAGILAALQAAIARGGFAAFKVVAIAANAVSRFLLGRGLSFAANAGLMRFLGVLSGPIGISISTVLSVPMVSGPAYRVTTRAVIYVAYLRQKYLNRDQL
ncbi:MAG: DUF3944 domain-containing protein [Verrucomicrobiota bacterium]